VFAKLGTAFITGVNALGAMVFFLGAAAFTAFAVGHILAKLTPALFGWRWPASNWFVLCLAGFVAFYGLGLVAPVLMASIAMGLKAAFWGALASAVVAWCYGIPWQPVAMWGGIGFFVVCVFAAVRQQRPAPPMPLPDIYGIGVDDPEKRLREEGYL
jgi:hypothetical protein